MSAPRRPDRIDEFLESLGRVHVPPDLVPDVMRRVRIERARRSPYRWLTAIAAATIMLAIFGTAAFWVGSEREPAGSQAPSAPASAGASATSSATIEPTPVADETPTPTPAALGSFDGSWAPIAEAPIPGRLGHSAVWTGTEVVVWGGDPSSARSDGAAYDPASDTWRVLATAPVGGRYFHVAAWTGMEMLVWGGLDQARNGLGDGAAYDLATDRWRRLPAAPLVGTGSQAAVWARDRWIVVDGVPAGAGPVRLGVAAYRPNTDSWSTLPGLELPSANAISVTSTGEDLVLLATAFDAPARGFLLRLGEPAPAWRSIAEPPLVGLSPQGTELWTGTEILVRAYVQGGGDRVVAYDPNLDRWRAATPPPAGLGGGPNTWTGTLAIFGLGTAGTDRLTVYDPGRDGWLALPRSGAEIRESATQIWTGDRLIVWDGPQDASSPPPPGGLAFVPAARYAIAAQEFEGAGNAVRVEVADASGTLTDVRPPTRAEMGSVDTSQLGASGTRAVAVPLGAQSVLVEWIGGPGDVAARVEIGQDGRSIDLMAVPTYGDAIPVIRAVVLSFDRPIAAADIALTFWGDIRQ